jgi:hypothetical protein
MRARDSIPEEEPLGFSPQKAQKTQKRTSGCFCAFPGFRGELRLAWPASALSAVSSETAGWISPRSAPSTQKNLGFSAVSTVSAVSSEELQILHEIAERVGEHAGQARMRKTSPRRRRKSPDR